MMRSFWFLIALICTRIFVCAEAGKCEIKKWTFPPPRDLIRADIFQAKTVPHPKAIVLLCPGCNEEGKYLVEDKEWQQFAIENNLGLLGLSFASDVQHIHTRGYYYASKGSGELLLRAIRKIYGRDLKLFIYGFSGGAHFTSRFEEWRPDRVISWCAYSAGWWDEPKHNKINPPGIVACGDQDPRYGASLTYFMQGRALDKRWTWISLPNLSHERTLLLEDFARKYWIAINSHSLHRSTWLDWSTKSVSNHIPAPKVLITWLPNIKISSEWASIHCP